MPAVFPLLNFKHGFDGKPGERVTTCRMGDKWANRPIGSWVLLFECQEPGPIVGDVPANSAVYRGSGLIVGNWFGPFHALPDELLQAEHNAGCRDKATLLATMKQAYGDKFTEASVVTMLEYVVSDGKPL